jgi:hypothetical protein
MNAATRGLAAAAACFATGANADSVMYSGSFSGLADVTDQVIKLSPSEASPGKLPVAPDQPGCAAANSA